MGKLRKKFSKRLKEIRVQKGMTQEALAEALGINVRYIQLLESKTPPNVKLDTIETLAQVLKTKPNELL